MKFCGGKKMQTFCWVITFSLKTTWITLFGLLLSIVSSPCVCGRRYQIKIPDILSFLHFCFHISPLTFTKIDSTSQHQRQTLQLLCFNLSIMVFPMTWLSPAYGAQTRACVQAAGAPSPATLPGDAVPPTNKTTQQEGALAAGGRDSAYKICRVFSPECNFFFFFFHS